MDNLLIKLNDIFKILYSNNNNILLDIINKINILIEDLNKQKDTNELKNLIPLINKAISDNKINFEKFQKIIKELNNNNKIIIISVKHRYKKYILLFGS